MAFPSTVAAFSTNIPTLKKICFRQYIFGQYRFEEQSFGKLGTDDQNRRLMNQGILRQEVESETANSGNTLSRLSSENRNGRSAD